MNIEKYLSVLPDEVLLIGQFCVTRHGDKKPFDPFKGHIISAKDDFYDIFTLLNADDIESYDTIGIKVVGEISSIDIDHCMVDGKPNKLAEDIIHSIRSYTEVSPSGTGIRILFRAMNKFDRNKYKIKNSSRGLEYYDGMDQLENGARMVRLSGNKIFNYGFATVDTTKVLDRYMARDFTQTAELDHSKEINEAKCFFIGEFLKKDYSIYDIYYRHISTLSESEWDLILANHISFYTNNINEIRYIFERTTYYKNKDERHLNKWNNTKYSENLLKKVRPTLCDEKVLSFVELFNEFTPQDNAQIDPSLLVHLSIQIGFIKPSYMSKYHINLNVANDGQTIVNHLMDIARHRKGILKYLQGLFEETV